MTKEREAASSTALKNPMSLIHTTLDQKQHKEGLFTAKEWGKRWDSLDEKNQKM